MVSNPDSQRWQHAIDGIVRVQNKLSPEELSAFSTLVSLLNTGNLEAGESEGYIRVMKNALQRHGKNRILEAYLTNFVRLCEKYFKVQTRAVVAPAPVVSPPPVMQSFAGIAAPVPQTSPSGAPINMFIPPEIKPPVAQPEQSTPVFIPPVIEPPVKQPEPSIPVVIPSVIKPPVEQPEPSIPVVIPPEIKPPVEQPGQSTPVFIPPVIEPPVKQPEPSIPVVIPPPVVQPPPKKKSNSSLILMLAAVIVLIGGWQVYQNWDTVKTYFVTPPPPGIDTLATVSINPLVGIGAWQGTLNNMEAAFEFLSIAEGQVEATMHVFANHATDSLRGTMDGLFIMLRNAQADVLYYTGTLRSDSSTFSGTVYQRENGDALAFEFYHPEKTSPVSDEEEVRQNEPEPVTTPLVKKEPEVTKRQPPPQPKEEESPEAIKAFTQAQNAFEKGQYDDAFIYYNEAINYKTPNALRYKQTASKQFTDKARQFIELEICDDNTRKWLYYAKQLYFTDEIQRLMNQCK